MSQFCSRLLFCPELTVTYTPSSDNMHRLQRLLLLQRQANLFLNSTFESQRLHVVRGCAVQVGGCYDQRQTDKFTTLVADLSRRLSYTHPRSSRRRTRETQRDLKANFSRLSDEGFMSDKDGIISRKAVTLKPNEQTRYRSSSRERLLLPDSHVVKTSNTDTFNKPHIDQSSANQDGVDKQPSAKKQPDSQMPSQQQLELVKEEITKVMPNLFKATSHKYSLYTQDMVFENNLWGENKIYQGIQAYAIELMKLRNKVNFAYCNVVMYVIKIDTDVDTGTIRMRWNMKGVPQLEGFKFWKWNLFNLRGKGGVKEKMSKKLVTYDGFNTFHVNKDGLIFKHRMDRVMPDQEKTTSTPAVEKLQKLINRKLEGATTASSTDKVSTSKKSSNKGGSQ